MTGEETSYEWAVRVHCTLHGVDGPHILDCTSRRTAERRHHWWCDNRPEARPELLRRTVITIRHPWEPL